MCYLGFNCFMYLNESLCLKFMEYIYRERRLVNIMRREWVKLLEVDGLFIIWLCYVVGNDIC